MAIKVRSNADLTVAMDVTAKVEGTNETVALTVTLPPAAVFALCQELTAAYQEAKRIAKTVDGLIPAAAACVCSGEVGAAEVDGVMVCNRCGCPLAGNG